MSELTRQKILQLVNKGYLVGFSDSSHQEFYPYYCGLHIDSFELADMPT